MTAGRFDVARLGEGVASIRIATDDDPYMGPAWVEELTGALRVLASDQTSRVVILEGAARYFCAGASREALTGCAVTGDVLSYAPRAVEALLELPQPIVAAAAGHAIGGGLLVALWCDVTLLAEESLYGANFMQLGFTPGMGATAAVPEAFGEPLGRELLLTGRLLTGRELREAGCPLAHAVWPRGEVYRRAVAVAREIALAPRASLELLKRALVARRRQGHDLVKDFEVTAHAQLFADPALALEVARRYPGGDA